MLITVHPHACGEHFRIHFRYSGGRGSSPRMWGTPVVKHNSNVRIRFIPTHVGNTVSDHEVRMSSLGSSPRMWGTLLLYIIDLPSNFRVVTCYQTIRLNLYYFVKDHFHHLPVKMKPFLTHLNRQEFVCFHLMFESQNLTLYLLPMP